MEFDSRHFGEFFADVVDNRYHIFSKKRSRQGFYPNQFRDYSPIDIGSLKEGDRITVRVFFAADKSETPRVDGGEIDLEVEFIESETMLWANILTLLPAHFPLAKGTSIELDIDEVIRVQTA